MNRAAGMKWIIGGSEDHHKHLPDDIRRVVDSLQRKMATQREGLAESFNGDTALFAARAPGRLDVMGGIADYSGSMVLQRPIAESAVALCQRTTGSTIRIFSQTEDGSASLLQSTLSVKDFYDNDTGRPSSLVVMHDYFCSLPVDQQWSAYVAGAFSVLILEYDLRVESGFSLYLESTVPIGKGVSSSAAIEVASMRAIAVMLSLDLTAQKLAVLCQRLENVLVGAPCGLMDQMTSSAGAEGHLLTLLCQPDIVKEPTQLPTELSVWGIDSGVRHCVSGADYTSVRVAAFMGYRILLEVAGMANSETAANAIQDNRWEGYLANVTVSELDQSLVFTLPDSMQGEEFVQRYGETTDTVTRVDPTREYAVKACTSHPVKEHFRVRLFRQLAQSLSTGVWDEESAQLMGECMYQSHASYSRCGLGSPGTDDIVGRLRNMGAENGIYGARITGGGSGGTVAILARHDAGRAIRAVAREYQAAAGIGGYVFEGTSAGATAHRLRGGGAK
ncbi:MAG: galactokinase [Granulosicoccus sp.]